MGIFTIVIAIAVIMFLARKRVNIGLAMFAGSGVLILGTPLSFSQVLAAGKAAYLNEVTWELAGAVVLIGVLGHILKASGGMDVMVDSLLRLVGDPRWLMVVLPGLIGALTVPGGAMMSAPIVDQLGDRTGIGPEHKTGINIIYRHIWYIALPILPSIILAASLAGLQAQKLALLNLPSLLVGLVSSWFILLHSLPGKTRGTWTWKDGLLFLSSIMPLLLAIVIYLVMGVGFVLALAIGIGVALVNLPPPGEKSLGVRVLSTGITRAKTMIMPGFHPQLLLVVAGIMFFKELMFTSNLINSFAADLVNLGIPLWLLVFILPLLVGLTTGSHEAAVGIAIPVFVPLLAKDIFLAGIGLTYISATIGYMISPLHLCIILTREYFGANFSKIYRYLAPIPLIMLATGLITALIRGL